MRPRRLQALRNLAERPGTPAEGELARELLARHEARLAGLKDYEILAQYCRDGDLESFRERMRREYPISGFSAETPR